MKKLLTLAAVAVLIFGLAAATYAVELTASGWIWQYMVYGINFGLPDPDDPTDPASNTGWDDTFAYSQIWSRLKFDLGISEDLKGVLQFEMGHNSNIWGEDGIAQFNADNNDEFRVKHVYVDFKVPGTDAFPTRATVGVQP